MRLAPVALVALCLLWLGAVPAGARILSLEDRGSDVGASIAAGVDDQVRVTVNGRDVSRELGLPQRGTRLLQLSPAEGLRVGRNVVRVLLRRSGRATRRAQAAITVRHPLVGAGLDREAAPGDAVALHGETSGPVSERHLHWRLLAAPEGSHAHLSDAHGLRAELRPDALGTYEVELFAATGKANAAQAGTGTLRDVVRVQAAPAQPLVELHALPPAGGEAQPTVRIGGQSYDADPVAGGQPGFAVSRWLVVAVERSTLGLVRKRTVQCGALADCVDGLHAALDGLTNEDMVVAALVSGPPVPRQFLKPLDKIGVRVDNDPALRDAQPGSYTAVGTPGMASGQAAELAAGRQPVGGLQTLLMKDQNGMFTPVGRAPVDYDLRVQGPSGRDAIRVGARVFETPSDASGFHVLVLNPYTLEPLSDRVQPTPAIPDEAYLDPSNRDADDQQALVFIASVGADPFHARGADGGAPWSEAVDDVVALGGTQSRLNADDAPGSYAMAGSFDIGKLQDPPFDQTPTAPAPEGFGRPGQPAATVRGALRVDYSTQRWVPSATGAGGLPSAVPGGADPGTALAQRTLTPPVPWPHADTPGQRLAAVCIGKAIGLTADPRRLYGHSADAPWGARANEIDRLKFEGARKVAGCAQGLDREDFQALKGDLASEARAVALVRGYFTVLAADTHVLLNAGQGQLQQFSDELEKQLNPPGPDDPYNVKGVLAFADKTWKLATTLLKTFVPETKDLLDTIALVRQVVEFGADLATIDQLGGKQTVNPLPTTTKTLGRDLSARLVLTRFALTQQAEAVVSDSARLRAVAAMHPDVCDPGPDDSRPCLPALNSARFAQTAKVFKLGLRAELTTSMMPKAFFRLELPPPDEGTRIQDFVCPSAGAHHQPFRDAPEDATFSPNVGFLRTRAVRRNQVLVKIGTRTETPSEDLLKPIFAPVDLSHVPLDAGKVTSGLGLDKERFFQSFGLERGHFCG